MTDSTLTPAPVLVNESCVFIALTPEQWVSCCQREGEDYLGGCCGVMSRVQDLMLGIFRNGGWAEHDKLAELCFWLRGHDGFNEADLPDPAAVREENPWAHVLWAWEVAGKKGTYCEAERLPGEDRDPFRDALRIVNARAWALEWAFLENDNPNPSLPLRGVAKQPPVQTHHLALRRLTIAQMLAALRTIFEQVATRDTLTDSPWEGFAVVASGTTTPLSLVSGIAIRDTREAAQEILTHNNLTSGYDVVPCTVSVESGLNFPPQGEDPFPSSPSIIA